MTIVIPGADNRPKNTVINQPPSTRVSPLMKNRQEEIPIHEQQFINPDGIEQPTQPVNFQEPQQNYKQEPPKQHQTYQEPIETQNYQQPTPSVKQDLTIPSTSTYKKQEDYQSNFQQKTAKQVDFSNTSPSGVAIHITNMNAPININKTTEQQPQNPNSVVYLTKILGVTDLSTLEEITSQLHHALKVVEAKKTVIQAEQAVAEGKYL